MTEPRYLKCPCRHCGGSIEFPAQGIGMAVKCPHCLEKTTLFAPPVVEAPSSDELSEPASGSAERTASPSPHPSPPMGERGPEIGVPEIVERAPEPVEAVLPEPAGRTISARTWLVAVFLIAIAAGGGLFWRHGLRNTSGVTGPGLEPARPRRVAAAGPATNPEPSSTASTGLVTATVLGPKSTDDFKIGAITLEKAKGSSLIYALGTLRNESEHQRFGVKLEFELMDARGAVIGAAKDYRAVIEPRQEWRFRALVLDAKAVTARVSSIREDE